MKKIDSSIFLTYKEQISSAIEDLKTKGRRHRQIPNLLTLIRLTAPCFIIPATIIGNLPLILGSITIFSLTDLADGFIARNWKLTSELGATLDTIADKVFACTLLLSASLTNPVLLCNLALECGIAGINVSKKINNVPVESSIIGKIKTLFLFSLAGVGIISTSVDIVSILKVLKLTTTVMQAFTIYSYLSPTSNKQKSDVIQHKENELLGSSTVVDIEPKELQKEKKIGMDASILKMKNVSLKQLKTLKQFLVSERTFLGIEDNELIDSKNLEKSKKDDFKKN